ncbi:MAG: VOC family protein [Burkholderiaceae bacterium]
MNDHFITPPAAISRPPPHSPIRSLGYVGVASRRLDEWSGFATGLLGMQCQHRSTASLALRVDDRQQRLMVEAEQEEGRHCFGWEVDGADALQSLAARLDAAGVPVRTGSGALAEQRGVRELIRFSDPAGHGLEVFHGAQPAAAPFAPSRALSGFRTGTLGLGHAVLTVANMAPMLAFYRELLGFRISDFMLEPFHAYFLHVNPRHHSLALIETGRNGVHHLMLELLSLDDVGQAYDLAQQQADAVGVTLGRHSNDFMTSFYIRSPSDFMIEYGWGGRAIDPLRWQPQQLRHGASLWGHERYWLPPEKRQEALEMRLRAAAQGQRAPVHVVDGYFVPMPPP